MITVPRNYVFFYYLTFSFRKFFNTILLVIISNKLFVFRIIFILFYFYFRIIIIRIVIIICQNQNF